MVEAAEDAGEQDFRSKCAKRGSKCAKKGIKMCKKKEENVQKKSTLSDKSKLLIFRNFNFHGLLSKVSVLIFSILSVILLNKGKTKTSAVQKMLSTIKRI